MTVWSTRGEEQSPCPHMWGSDHLMALGVAFLRDLEVDPFAPQVWRGVHQAAPMSLVPSRMVRAIASSAWLFCTLRTACMTVVWSRLRARPIAE